MWVREMPSKVSGSPLNSLQRWWLTQLSGSMSKHFVLLLQQIEIRSLPVTMMWHGILHVFLLQTFVI